jgi:hypothetical protein
MQDTLHNLSSHPDTTVSIKLGTEHWREGLTTLSLQGNGQLTLHNLRSGNTTKLTAQWDKTKVDATAQMLAQNDFLNLKTIEQPRQPGDVPVILSLSQDGNVVYEQKLWHGDRYDLPKLDLIIKFFDGVVHEMTGGQRFMPPPAPEKKKKRFPFFG